MELIMIIVACIAIVVLIAIGGALVPLVQVLFLGASLTLISLLYGLIKLVMTICRWIVSPFTWYVRWLTGHYRQAAIQKSRIAE